MLNVSGLYDNRSREALSIFAMIAAGLFLLGHLAASFLFFSRLTSQLRAKEPESALKDFLMTATWMILGSTALSAMIIFLGEPLGYFEERFSYYGYGYNSYRSTYTRADFDGIGIMILIFAGINALVLLVLHVRLLSRMLVALKAEQKRYRASLDD
ncbi:MAG: hypothetical protein R3B84_11395 [Zavarzinella sp.]